MPITREEFVARYGEKYASHYQGYDSDLKPQNNFRIMVEMMPIEKAPSIWTVLGATVIILGVLILSLVYIPKLFGY